MIAPAIRKVHMSKSKEEEKQVKTYTVKQIFWAVLPWALITLASVALAFTVTGWVLRSNDMSRVQSEARVLVESLKSQK